MGFGTDIEALMTLAARRGLRGQPRAISATRDTPGWVMEASSGEIIAIASWACSSVAPSLFR
jgi:hypothetical protein